MAETRVRIPVAVLMKAPPRGAFFVPGYQHGELRSVWPAVAHRTVVCIDGIGVRRQASVGEHACEYWTRRG
jgi:hypothetical protein